MLAGYFLDEFCSAYGRRPRRLTGEAKDALCTRSWPGNVRELRNLMERVVIMTAQAEIGVGELGLSSERRTVDRSSAAGSFRQFGRSSQGL